MLAQSEAPMSYEIGAKAFHDADFDTALTEWTKSAGDGDSDSCYNIGLMYANGSGVERDFETAVEWFHKAGEQDHQEAEYSLGVMYQVGFGVEEDDCLLGERPT